MTEIDKTTKDSCHEGEIDVVTVTGESRGLQKINQSYAFDSHSVDMYDSEQTTEPACHLVADDNSLDESKGVFSQLNSKKGKNMNSY